MADTTTLNSATSDLTCTSASAIFSHGVRAGRVVAIEAREGSDELTIRAPDGRLELSIVFTDKGASVSLEAADLRIGTPGDFELNCKRFEVKAEEAAQIYSDDRVNILSRETILRSSDYITMNAGSIRQQGP